jgi:hypothetical protein
MRSGLLDAAYAHLNFSYPNEEDKSKSRKTTLALSDHWRKVGLDVTLKAHIMGKNVCTFNDKSGI